jgi:hypothetical protein
MLPVLDSSPGLTQIVCAAALAKEGARAVRALVILEDHARHVGQDLAHSLGGCHLGQQRLLVDDRLEQAVEGVGQLADLVVPLDGQRLRGRRPWRISSSRSAERSRAAAAGAPTTTRRAPRTA